ncbi:LuxR C-terminal-related transcriptional regulator, partial [Klebsiella pneumoniae]|nr:LuxR C-terminal-related transcriptional regulator [Klebsiella pneumoniae]
AVGFIGKGSPLDAIEDAIRDALAGRVVGDGPVGAVDDVAGRLATLTPMQLKVLMRVLEGRLNKQIAHDLAISEATVKAHMTAVLRKL